MQPQSLLLALALLTLPASPRAQTERINTPFPHSLKGDVVSFAVDPQGANAATWVYKPSGIQSLYLAPLDGSRPPVLRRTTGATLGDLTFTPAGDGLVWTENYEPFSLLVAGSGHFRLLPGKSILTLKLTQDGTRVVARTRNWELFEVPLDMSAPAVLLATSVLKFELAPDSSQVVYQTSEVNGFRLYSRRIDGVGDPLQLSDSGPLEQLVITSDSTLAVYTAQIINSTSHDLFVVPLDGSAGPIRRNVVANGGSVRDFRLVGREDGILYGADARTSGRTELFLVPTRSGSGDLFSPPDATQDVFQLPPQAGYTGPILFRTGQNLYSRKLTPGSVAQRLNPDGVEVIFNVAAGRWVAFYSRAGDAFVVPADGSAPARNLGLGSRPYAFALSHDGRHLAYSVMNELQNEELFCQRIDVPDVPRRLTAEMRVRNSLWSLQTTASGRFVYRAADRSFDRYRLALELHSVDPASGTNVMLHPPFPQGPSVGHVSNVHLSADQETLLYEWAPDAMTPMLHVVRGGEPVRELVGLMDHTVWWLAPDASWVLLWAQNNFLRAELDGDSAPRKIASLSGRGSLMDLHISPDGSFVMYTFSGIHFYLQEELFLARADGSAPAWEITPDLTEDESVQGQWISPDSQWIVYGISARLSHTDYYSVPSDGSAPPRLLGSVPYGYGVWEDPITPDSKGIILNDGQGLLWISIQDGSRRLIPERGLSMTRYTPDGSHIVFTGDPDRDGLAHVGSLPVDLSQPIVWSGAPADAGYRVSFDSRWVVSKLGNDLWSAPLDGSSPAHVLQVSEQVRDQFELSPDGRWVVFSTTNGILYAAPVDGSRAPLALARGLDSALTCSNFEIAPDSRRVAFRSIRRTPDSFELFEVPIDGSRRPQIVHPPLAAGSIWRDTRQQSFYWREGKHLYFLADQDIDMHYELYSSESHPPRVFTR